MKKLLLCASAFALMLGSCSKDDTEIAPVEVKGKVAFSASMTVGDGSTTRTHIDADATGNLKYYWDDGDMIGASVVNGSEVVPFIVAQADAEKAKFVVVDEDLNYLGAGPYYLVYPYDKDAQVGGSATAPTVDLTIPASQRYRSNSFATMTVPAVGKIDGDYRVDPDATEDKEAIEDVEVTMYPATSFIRVPVLGAGTLSNLKLQIRRIVKDTPVYNVLNGTKSVSLKDVSNAAIDLTSETVSSGTNDYVEINFGQTGKKLSLTEADTLYFVVPANIVLSEATLVFTPTIDGKEAAKVEYTAPKLSAEYATLKRNTIQPIKAIMLGTENMVMINNTEDFLKYAFAANYNAAIGLSADPINDRVVAEYYKDGKFKTAVLLADLNYRNYAAQDQYQNALKSDEQDALLLAALESYMKNGGIEAFSKAASIDGNGHKISYLPVYGNGIFEAAPSLLKDLTIQQATVNVPDGTKTAASFLGRLTSFRNVSGVTISGGSLLNVGEGVTPTLVGASVSASALPTKAQMTVSRYPSVNGVAADYAYYAATLTINADVDASNADKTGFFNTATPRFAKFKGSKDGVIISKVSNATYAKAILDAVDNAGKSFSVMDRANISYWTGTVPASVTDDGIVTAEDLAYYVQNGGTVTLTNNIDLQGEQRKEWVLDNGSAALNITGNGKYTISNALVKSQKVTEPYVAYSLLGNVVNAKDIVVDGVTIDVDNVEGSTAQLYVGGIGYQGSANGVKVSNLTIDIAEDVKVSRYNEVGGLISAPTAASEKNAVTDLSINVNGNETVGLVGGMFAKASESFNENSLAYKAEAADKYAMIAAWTLSNNAVVSKCNADVAIVGDVNFAPTDAGQVISLTYDCPEPFCDYLVNTKGYNIAVDINGKVRSLEPGKNPFKNEE